MEILDMFGLFSKTRQLKEIESYGLDWSLYSDLNNISIVESACSHFVTNWKERGFIIPGVMDTSFYLEKHTDVLQAGVNPLIHYIRAGRFEERAAFRTLPKVGKGLNEKQIKADIAELSREDIDWRNYSKQYSLSSDKDAIKHYSRYWSSLHPAISESFDTEFYLACNPDLQQTTDNPLIHYLKVGKSQGRHAISQVTRAGYMPNGKLPKISKTTIQNDCSTLKEADLFWDNYIEKYELRSTVEAVVHFCTYWHIFLPDIGDFFSTSYYLSQRPELWKLKKNPLVDYLTFGKGDGLRGFPESRHELMTPCAKSFYSNVPQLKVDLPQSKQVRSTILEHSLNWDKYIKQYKLKSVEEAISHYIENWSTLLPNLKDVFDTKHYVSAYPDVLTSGVNPLVHYLTWGEQEGRQGSPDPKIPPLPNAFKAQFLKALQAFDLVPSEFEKINNLGHPIKDPARFILRYFQTMDIKLPGIFDSSFYLDLNQDLKESGVDPLVHFVQHGHGEGRLAYFDAKKHFKTGDHTFDKDKDLIAIVCHESSATGAPLVGYNLAAELSKQYNIVNIVLRKSKLQEAFESECVASFSAPFNEYNFSSLRPAIESLKYIEQKLKPVSGIICNSVETIYLLQAARKMGIPSVSLVHEFSEYTKPAGKITHTIFNADRVIVPAKVIRDSACRELEKYSNIKTIPNNIIVQPQGKLHFIPEGQGKLTDTDTLLNMIGVDRDDDNCRILVGAGFVQIRKGLDLFVAAAQRIKELCDYPCKFVWVGEGYDPDNDLAYANWVQTQISLYGLKDDIVFLGHQRNLNNIMSIADVFLMTSRLDPFPNVVIDALSADVHVGCFAKSTGCAEFLVENNANATVVDYLDTEQLGQGISDYLNSGDKKPLVNKKLVAAKLDFDAYVQKVENELQQAKKARNKHNDKVQTLRSSGLFNANYYNPELTEDDAIDEYVNLGGKGIHLFNPAPGFNELMAIASHDNMSEYSVPLLEAHRGNISKNTHTCYVIDEKQSEKSTLKGKYAVHLHLFYTELVEEFVGYFSCLPGRFDLYITYVDNKQQVRITKAFKKCGANKVFLKKVKNIGRDIGPLFVDLKNDLVTKGYDVVGHFHSKKSLDASEEMGDRWRKFLMDTLIGDKDNASRVLQQLNDKNVGLVFAEDRHCVDEGKNRKYISTLCEELNIEEPENTRIFPIGTMFWARVDALKPLFDSDFKKYIQPEPLPYDGSYMHSIERLIPNVCESMGCKFLTIHRDDVNW